MSSASKPPESDKLLDEACTLLARLQSGEDDPMAAAKCAAWRSRSSEHERAWQRAERVWKGFEPLRADPDLPGAKPLPFEQPAPHRRSRPTWRRLRKLATAAVVLISLAAGSSGLQNYWQADYLTGKGERLSQTLEDGSKITLNTDSAVDIQYDGQIRRIRLLAGEAFFEVARDADHPFVVSAEAGELRAVGTAFSVRRDDDGLRVDLVEGVVEVTHARSGSKARLRAGQTAVLEGRNLTVGPPIRPDGLALWREGYLQFDGVPLKSAIAEINRYRPGRVVLLDDGAGSQRVSGLFRLDALDQAVDTVAGVVPGLRKTAITPYLVFLR